MRLQLEARVGLSFQEGLPLDRQIIVIASQRQRARVRMLHFHIKEEVDLAEIQPYEGDRNLFDFRFLGQNRHAGAAAEFHQEQDTGHSKRQPSKPG